MTPGDFIEPTFFGYVQEASGDDDRFVTEDGDVYIRTDYDESLDMPHKAFNELEKTIFGVATVELKERPLFTWKRPGAGSDFGCSSRWPGAAGWRPRGGGAARPARGVARQLSAASGATLAALRLRAELRAALPPQDL